VQSLLTIQPVLLFKLLLLAVLLLLLLAHLPQSHG
jgi:hypothetical protein